MSKNTRDKTTSVAFLAIALALPLTARLSAGEDDTKVDQAIKARAIIGKAIKAMGMDKDREDWKGLRVKSKGTLEFMGKTHRIWLTLTIRLPDQFSDLVEVEVNNMKFPLTTVYDGKIGWEEAGAPGGNHVKLDDMRTAELKEISNLLKIIRLKPVLDKGYKLALVGEVKVEDKSAVGVRVSSKAAKDVSLFFDKMTGVLVKVKRQALDTITMQEVLEERIIRSYRDRDGQKIPHEVIVLWDGKKLLELEVTDHTPLINVDASEFEMPK